MPLSEQDIQKFDEMLAKVTQMYVKFDEASRRANTEHYRRLHEAEKVTLTPEGKLVIKDKEL